MRRFALALGLTGLLLAIGACTDSDPILFPGTAQIEVELATDAVGQAGEILSRSLTIRTVDPYGNPVPDVPLVINVVTNDGSVENTPSQTLQSGEVSLNRWRMGSSPGPNELEIRAAGAEPVRVSVDAGAGPPARIIVIGDEPDETIEVASFLSGLPEVRVEDQFENPISGVSLTVRASEGGQAAESDVVTNQDGRAQFPDWTLAEQAGVQTLRATLGSLSARLEVNSIAGPPARVVWVEPTDLKVVAGLVVPDDLEIQITDRYENPVEGGWSAQIRVTGGGGSIEQGSVTTDASGRALVGAWTLGSSPGTNSLEVEVPGLPTSSLEVEGMPQDWDPEGLFLRVGSVHVNQAAQRTDGSIGLVRDRPGLLRVMPLLGRATQLAPDADIVVYRDGLEVMRERVELSSPSIPEMLSPSANQPAWNLPLSADVLEGDIGIRVYIDPDEDLRVVSRRFHQYPEDGEARVLATTSMPPFIVRFVSMRDGATGVAGNIDETNFEDFVRDTRRVFPIGQDSMYLGPEFVTSLLADGGVTTAALTRLWNAWRANDDLVNEFLHGIFPASQASGFSGVAYVGTLDTENPSNTPWLRPVGMTWDALSSGAGFTVAHELGHNMGQPHAPCGNPSGVDPNFPHGNAFIGVVGYDGENNQLMSPTGNRDLMSYCGPRWISDYNYERVFVWRDTGPMGRGGPGNQSALLAAAVSNAGGAMRQILVSAVAGSDAIHLEPILHVQTAPSVEPAAPSHRIRGWDRSGRLLFDRGTVGVEVAHAPDPEEVHIGSVITLSEADVASLDRVSVDPVGVPARAPAPGVPDDDNTEPTASNVQWSRVDRLADGIRTARESVQVRGPGLLMEPAPGAPTPPTQSGHELVWDPQVFPQVVIRHRDTGEILGIVGGGKLRLDLWDHDIQLSFSDGVRSWSWTDNGLVPEVD